MSRDPRVTRRALLGGLGTLPLVALVSSPPLIAACGGRPPETPLAHLYGKEWVHGAYKLYAHKYVAVQTSAEESSADAYRVLAQKGVVALDALQARGVPFYARVTEDGRSFKIQREVPSRLTFTADMTEADRKSAEVAWKKAREHIQTDYEEVRRLDWALTRLLGQVQRIRTAVDQGRLEQFRLVDQLLALDEDPTKLPYELPYQVTPKDYDEILLLLLERLQDDRRRLEVLEANVVAVGMTARSTDANSATMAASLRKVLLAVLEDVASDAPRPAVFPAKQDERAALLTRARALKAQIAKSPEFVRWRKEETEKRLAAIGAFLTVLDQATGLPTSQIYRTVVGLWQGDHDYLTYIKTIAGLVPHGGAVARTIAEAIDYTEKARKVGGAVLATVKGLERGSVSSAATQIAAQAKARATAEAKGVVLNTASKFALDRVNRQLSFFKDDEEVKRVTSLIGETDLVRRAIPNLPAGL